MFILFLEQFQQTQRVVRAPFLRDEERGLRGSFEPVEMGRAMRTDDNGASWLGRERRG